MSYTQNALGTLREHTLRQIRVRACAEIPEDMIHGIDITVHDLAAHVADGLLVQLETFLWGERAEHTLCVSTPASWWQHFKQDCLPTWVQRWLPVRYEQIRQTVHAGRLFPHAPAPRSKVGNPVLRILEIEPRKLELIP